MVGPSSSKLGMYGFPKTVLSHWLTCLSLEDPTTAVHMRFLVIPCPSGGGLSLQTPSLALLASWRMRSGVIMLKLFSSACFDPLRCMGKR